MMTDVDRFLNDGGEIVCESIAERNEVFSFLRNHGYSLGFQEHKYKDKNWFHIYLYDGYVHMSEANNQRRPELTFNGILSMYMEGNDLLAPDPDITELPDISELIPGIRIEAGK